MALLELIIGLVLMALVLEFESRLGKPKRRPTRLPGRGVRRP